jgi:hypothetical protein
VSAVGQSVNDLRTSRKCTIQLEEKYCDGPNMSHFLREHLLFSLLSSKEVTDLFVSYYTLIVISTEDICFLFLH